MGLLHPGGKKEKSGQTVSKKHLRIYILCITLLSGIFLLLIFFVVKRILLHVYMLIDYDKAIFLKLVITCNRSDF